MTDPVFNSDSPEYADLVAKVTEIANRKITRRDLPMNEIIRQIIGDGNVDPNEFLLPNMVGYDLLEIEIKAAIDAAAASIVALTAADVTINSVANDDLAVWKTIHHDHGVFSGFTALNANAVPFQTGDLAVLPPQPRVPHFLFLSNVAALVPEGVTGKTPKLRIRTQLMTNTIDPVITGTVSLYPIHTPVGGAGTFGWTLGAAVAGSGVTILPNAVSTTHNNASPTAGFDVPAPGYYVLGVIGSAGQAANSLIALNAQLQFSHR